MRGRQRREEVAAAKAQARALRASIAAPATDVAALVRQELARQRAEEAAEAARTEAAKFAGGPCVHCGTTDARSMDVLGPDAGVVRPDWHYSPRGQECGTCKDWRDLLRPGTADSELYDKVARVLEAEGVDALHDPNRRSFTFEPGLAERLGVGPWVDSGQPPGGRWLHLAPVAERLERERSASVRPASPTWNEVIEAGAVPLRETVIERALVDGRWQTVVVEEGAPGWSFDREGRVLEMLEVGRRQYAPQGGR